MNQHSFYTYVSRQLHPASYGISLINDGNSLDSPLDIAQCFSAEFSKNFSISACDEIAGIPIICNGPKLDLINVDIGTVRKLLMQQCSSAAGPDGIPGFFYRKLAGVLAQPLATVFQQSLYQRAIPDMWRNALVIPLFKGKGSKASASSYRPVSLSDIACKVLERVIVNQIRNFWLANNMLCREQHGFLPRCSTVSNLITCDSLISNLLNEDNTCDVILLDFARAFDKVPHNIILQKLTRLGIVEQPLEWISNFLSARSHVMSYNGTLSEATPVSSGVIQGSTIGSLLFVAFINDLPSLVSNCDFMLFADDSKAVGKCNNRDEHALIQKDLNAISNWSAENHLPFSIEKCACLHYGCRNPNLSYSINGSSVKCTETCTDLGIIRTSDFRYKSHIDAICLKASRLCAMVFRLFSTRNKAFMCKLYTFYIRPLLEYASTVWNPQELGLSRQLETIQHRFTRRLFGSHAPSYEDRLQLLAIPSLSTRRRNADLMLAYKLIHKLIDLNSSAAGVELCKGITRSASINLTVRRAKSTLVKKSFNYRIAAIWNKLPIETKQYTKISVFKSHLRHLTF